MLTLLCENVDLGHVTASSMHHWVKVVYRTVKSTP